jgi:hypothetical protein
MRSYTSSSRRASAIGHRCGLQGCVLILAAAVAVAVGPRHAPALQAASLDIEVSWAEAQRQIRPQQANVTVNRRVRAVLNGDSSITETMSTEGPAGPGQETGRFRGESWAGRASVSWQVEDSRTFVRTATYPQHLEVLRLTVASDKSCRATLSFQLRPGFREYLKWNPSDGSLQYFSAVTAGGITCRAAGAF